MFCYATCTPTFVNTHKDAANKELILRNWPTQASAMNTSTGYAPVWVLSFSYGKLFRARRKFSLSIIFWKILWCWKWAIWKFKLAKLFLPHNCNCSNFDNLTCTKEKWETRHGKINLCSLILFRSFFSRPNKVRIQAEVLTVCSACLHSC